LHSLKFYPIWHDVAISKKTKIAVDQTKHEVVSMDIEANAALLKKKGLKITTPRLAVLEIFQKSKDRHLSAEDVYKEALSKDGDLGLATVYRVLTQLSEVGLLAATNFETGKTTFELNEGGHHDIWCA